MDTLYGLLVDSAAAAETSQAADGSMPPGHNGPYGDPETPVRTTAHWLITFAKAYAVTGEARYREATRRAAGYLLRPDVRPAGATFWLRTRAGKDRCNGLIGQAWVIEALVEAAAVLHWDECRELARAVFLMHPFEPRAGLWRRVEIDGTVGAYDRSLNHQIWFAAAGSLLIEGDGGIAERVTCSLDRLPRNLRLYPSGLIYHDVADVYGRLAHRPVRRVRRRLAALARQQLRRGAGRDRSYRLRDPAYAKAVGYHAFNLYAFGLLRTGMPQHRFWSSSAMRRMVAYLASAEYRDGLESNRYGYPYNPAGMEAAFALHTFADLIGPAADRVPERMREWIGEQLRRCYDGQRHRLDRNTEDPATLAARLYESTRLPDLKLAAEVPVVCSACREERHEECRGGTWCDCQHRPPRPTPPVTGPAGP